MSADLIGDDACREAFNKARQQRFSVHGLDVVCEPDIFRAGYAAGRDSEIAKRDARIVELEHRCGVYGLELHNATERLQQAERQIKAIKAQEPVAWAGVIEDCASLFVTEPQLWKAIPLYAAPVSEAKAQGVVIDADDLAQFIREIDGNHKMGAGVLAEHIAEHIADSLNTAPVQQAEYGDAYQGAREDLAIWKRRTLEAEEKVRQQEQIIDHLTSEAQGESRFGEPVITAGEPCVPDGYVLADKKSLGMVLQALVNAPHHIRELQVTLQPVELFSDNPINVLIANYEAPAATVQQPKCRTCDDNGLIGGPSFYSPDEGGEPCPDCSAPVQQVSVQDGWRSMVDRLASTVENLNEVARGQITDDMEDPDYEHGLCDKHDDLVREARAMLDAAPAAPAAPAADAGIVDMYRHLQKVTPYRFKKIQDASITDGGDVMYFHKDRFDAALLADMAAHRAKGVV